MTDATTPNGVPTLRWLLEKLRRGEMTAQEFVKLSRERGDRLTKEPRDNIVVQDWSDPSRIPRV